MKKVIFSIYFTFILTLLLFLSSSTLYAEELVSKEYEAESDKFKDNLYEQVVEGEKDVEEAIEIIDWSRLEEKHIVGEGDGGHRDGSYHWARFFFPRGINEDEDGNLLIADSQNHRLRKVNSEAENVETIVGISTDYDDYNFPSGGYVDGEIDEAKLNEPRDMAVNSDGTVFFTDGENHSIRKIDDGSVYTFAGSGQAGHIDEIDTEAKFNIPSGIDMDEDNNLYIADSLNGVIRVIDEDGETRTLPMKFREPYDVLLDNDSNSLYVSDSGGQRIWELDIDIVEESKDVQDPDYDLDNEDFLQLYPEQEQEVPELEEEEYVESVVGGGETYMDDSSYIQGDHRDGFGENARFDFPKGMTITEEGTLLVADGWNQSIRAVCPETELVITLYKGDLEGPMDVHLSDDSLFISDMWHNQILELNYNDEMISQKLSHTGNDVQDIIAQMKDEKERVESRFVSGDELILQVENEQVEHLRNDSEIDTWTLDTPPIIEQGRTLIPVQGVLDKLGAELEWQGYEGQVVITIYENLNKDQPTVEEEIILTIDSHTALIDDEQVELDVAPQIFDERTLVPLRFLSERLGHYVEWDSLSREIRIEIE